MLSYLTKWPWELLNSDFDPELIYIFSPEEDRIVARVRGNQDDALAMNAAPEMIEALELAILRFKKYKVSLAAVVAMEKMEKALAKARGEE